VTCRGTLDAIDADGGSFWRARFREKFAFAEGRQNDELRRSYQHRMRQLRRGTGYPFFRGHNMREKDVVGVLKELIVGKPSCSFTKLWYMDNSLLEDTCPTF
jgi:hypothetical protein